MITEDDPQENALITAESRGLTKRSSALVRRALENPLTLKAMSNSIGMEFVFVPPGSFEMGSSNGGTDEMPVHRVTIGQGFFMGKYQVTQGQWQAVMGNNPSHFKGDENLPVEQVSWNDTQDFINNLNEVNDRYEYRLPTEAEWEYACRAGTIGDYVGDLDPTAWCYENAGDIRLSDNWSPEESRENNNPTHLVRLKLTHAVERRKLAHENNNRTHPIGLKQPNHFGLFDMHGNVREWCQDWYHSDYSGAPTDGSARLQGSELEYRALRGSSVFICEKYMRSSARCGSVPTYGLEDAGFRLVAVVRIP